MGAFTMNSGFSSGAGLGTTWDSNGTCCWWWWRSRWWLIWHYCHGRRLWNHVQNYLWWNVCLRLLLLQNRIIESLLHLLVSNVLLLHYYTKLLCVCLHHLHSLIVHVDIGHLICCVVCVVVRFKMPGVDVVCNMPRFCSKVLNEIPLLQGSVPHHAS